MDLLVALAPFGLFLTWASGLIAWPFIKKGTAIAFHKVTRGSKAIDNEAMVMVLTSLREFPDDWKITEKGAQFPKTGSYQIALERNNSNGVMQLSLGGDSSDGRFRDVNPFFDHEVTKLLTERTEAARREIVERNLFPNGMPLMLESRK
jgi:hypothetical protein